MRPTPVVPVSAGVARHVRPVTPAKKEAVSRGGKKSAARAQTRSRPCFCCGRGGAACVTYALRACRAHSRPAATASGCGRFGGSRAGGRPSVRRTAGSLPTVITRAGRAICLTTGGIGGGRFISRCVSSRGWCFGGTPSLALTATGLAGRGVSS